jgi:membrane associated rhomboid family serine protease
MLRPIITSRPAATIAILKINIFVFMSWVMSAFINPYFMINNFLVSWTGIVEGRFWTLLTSVFSHNMFFHIFLNMYVFFGFGAVLEQALGTRRFLRFYLAAGVVASLSHVTVSAFLIGDPSLAALGASGAISGVILLFSLMFPQERVLLLGIIPIPALFASFAIVALDVWGLVEQTLGGKLPIGHGAHLGGALYGLVYYLIAVRRDGSGFRFQT